MRKIVYVLHNDDNEDMIYNDFKTCNVRFINVDDVQKKWITVDNIRNCKIINTLDSINAYIIAKLVINNNDVYNYCGEVA